MRMVNGPWLVSLLCWWTTNRRLRFCSAEDSLLLLLLSFSSLCRVFTVIYLKQTVFLWHIYCCSCAVFTTCATWNVVWYVKYILCSYIGACGSAVGWGTTLQAWRSQVHIWLSLECFIDKILRAALWPWGRLSLWWKWRPGIFPGR